MAPRPYTGRRPRRHSFPAWPWSAAPLEDRELEVAPRILRELPDVRQGGAGPCEAPEGSEPGGDPDGHKLIHAANLAPTMPNGPGRLRSTREPSWPIYLLPLTGLGGETRQRSSDLPFAQPLERAITQLAHPFPGYTQQPADLLERMLPPAVQTEIETKHPCITSGKCG